MSGMQPLFWEENTQARIGPGISRPREGERTKEFTLTVRTGNSMPMTWITRAPSLAKAMKFAKSRWPDCTVEVKRR